MGLSAVKLRRPLGVAGGEKTGLLGTLATGPHRWMSTTYVDTFVAENVAPI